MFLIELYKQMTFRKMVNRPDQPPTTLASKINAGVELFGSLKGAYEVGKSVWDAGLVAAPYVARGIAALV
jgi:hypothetical protein